MHVGRLWRLQCLHETTITAASFLTRALTNLDDDGPTLAIYCLPRLLLAPPPSPLPRNPLTPLIRDRAERLRSGHAHTLWVEYDWLAATPTPLDFPKADLATTSS